MKQEIIWTALPAGWIDAGRGQSLQLSVYVAPRLTADPAANQLKAFPAFINWPETVKGMDFTVVFSDGTQARARLANSLEPRLWDVLFPPATRVNTFEFTDLSTRAMRSFPAADAMVYLKRLYSTLAANGDVGHPALNSPAYDQLINTLGSLTDDARKEKMRYDENVDQLLKPRPGKDKKNRRVLPWSKPDFFQSPEEYAFYQADRFYRRVESRDPMPADVTAVDAAAVPLGPAEPKTDFHQRLAALADHPGLMRRLGLVLDLVFEPVAVPAKGNVKVEPSKLAKPASPWTQCLFSKKSAVFSAAPVEGSEIVSGQLDLSKTSDQHSPEDYKLRSPYALSQADVDSSVIKLLQFTRTLSQLRRERYLNEPDTTPAPALRSNGISLLRRDRALTLTERLVRNTGFDEKIKAGDTANVIFSADDLVRGYRIDVWDGKTGKWHSLCLRKGKYRLGKPNGQEMLVEIDEEGYLKHASTSSKDGGASDLYLHESLFGFDGWSLVAPRPGQPLTSESEIDVPANTVKQRDFVAPPTADRATDFPFAFRFSPQKGSLPRLRYGDTYRFRVRIVDLAGNSLPDQLDDEQFASLPIVFGRFDPVPSPTLVPRTVYSEGESLETLVIRSNYDQTAEAYGKSAPVQAAIKNRPYDYLPHNDRHLIAPKSTQQQCELHGGFDKAFGPDGAPAALFHLARREAATLFDTTQIDPVTGAIVPIPDVDIQVVSPAGVVTPTTLPLPRPGDALQAGEYILHKEAQLTTPYLPDPIARGVSFVGLPDEPLLQIEYDKKWPTSTPFRLSIVERPGALVGCTQMFNGSGESKWEAATRVNTVFLHKAAIVRVNYSSYFNEKDLKQLGLWGWLTEAQQKKLKKLILEGRHWLFTPWRTITLVHAVQQPLCVPKIKQIGTSKKTIGQTFAWLAADTHLSAKSTDQVDLEAWWQEPEDDPVRPAPRILENRAAVARLKVAYEADDHHALPPLDDSTTAWKRQRESGVKHEFGDTKYRKLLYRLTGTSRFREYFPPEITRDPANITRREEFHAANGTTPAVPVAEVLNSARPAAPSVLYVLPTFSWSRSTSGETTTHSRNGNGLRIWLERPWYSSGDGELLGVVYASNKSITAEMAPFSTQVGHDPIALSTLPKVGVDKNFFPGAAHGTFLSLDEFGSNSDSAFTLNVSGFPVYFDESRKLWYCDIVLSAGTSYWPFVRLALARYQPKSLNDAHLSRVVMTDFAQIAPHRRATLARANNRQAKLTLSGYTSTATSVSLGRQGPAKSGPNTFEVTVEYLPEGASEFGWTKEPDATVTNTPRLVGGIILDLPKGTVVPRGKALATKTAATKVAAKKTAAKATTAKVGAVENTLAGSKLVDVSKVEIGQIEGGIVGVNPDILQFFLPKIKDLYITLPAVNRRRRVVIEELEWHYADDPATLAAGKHPTAASSTHKSRLVYADIIEI